MKILLGCISDNGTLSVANHQMAADGVLFCMNSFWGVILFSVEERKTEDFWRSGLQKHGNIGILKTILENKKTSGFTAG